jgi:hypothetical protein
MMAGLLARAKPNDDASSGILPPGVRSRSLSHLKQA